MYYTVICKAGGFYHVIDTFTNKLEAQTRARRITDLGYYCVILGHKKPLRELVISRGGIVRFSNGLRAWVGENQI